MKIKCIEYRGLLPYLVSRILLIVSLSLINYCFCWSDSRMVFFYRTSIFLPSEFNSLFASAMKKSIESQRWPFFLFYFFFSLYILLSPPQLLSLQSNIQYKQRSNISESISFVHVAFDLIVPAEALYEKGHSFNVTRSKKRTILKMKTDTHNERNEE